MLLKSQKGKEEMSVIPEDIQEHWRVVQSLFSIRNEDEYDLAIE